MTRFDPLCEHIACPNCDALSRVSIPNPGQKVRCARCHRVLIAPRRHAGAKIVLLALISLALVIGVATQPFVAIRRFGISNDASLIEAAMSFDGPMQILSVVVLALVLVLPLMRLLLALYVVAPLALDRPALPGAARAFRWSESLRPWSMAEIFAIGAGVALIKIVDLATVSLGPAFWMLVGLVLLIAIQNTLMCRWSVWSALEK